MMAPVVSRYYARLLTGGERHPLFDAWDVRRFQPGGATPATSTAREDMIIG
jgi:glycine/D-amino acid oxidase-like deaminating enzyme